MLRNGWETTAISAVYCFLPTVVQSVSGYSEGPPPILNSKDYASPSGECVLHVNPSDLHGRGPGEYTLRKQGEVQWSAQRPYTLWEAGVTDNGEVAGYAYTDGWERMGEFVVVVIDPQGKERVNESVRREYENTAFSIAQRRPWARGMFLNQEQDCFVVRMADNDQQNGYQSWWRYQISTGLRIESIEPRRFMTAADQLGFVVAATAIPRTPLTVVHGMRTHCRDGAADEGASFALIDRDGNSVWRLDLDRDYNVPGDEQAEAKLQQYIRTEGAIFPGNVPERFEVYFAAAKKRVIFSVKHNNGQWKVVETARIDFALPPENTPPPVSFPDVEVKPLGTLVLQGSRSDQPNSIRNVGDFTLDDRGNIAFIRQGPGASPTFVRVDQNENVLNEISLSEDNSLEARVYLHHAWVGGERHIVTGSVSGIATKSWAKLLDCSNNSVQPLPNFDCPFVEALAGFPNGCFVAITNTSHKYTFEDNVFAFDREGKRIWQLSESAGKEPGHIFSPEDIAVTTDQRVAVLDVIRDEVQLFDSQGQYLNTISLDAAWGRKANYPSGISSAPDGGVVVHDFNGDPSIVWMEKGGGILRQFTPRHADGRTFVVRDGVKIAPDGKAWTSDGNSLLRLTETGMVDCILGEAADANPLGHISGIHIVRDRIYAVAQRTGGVYVFDLNGKHLFTCQPDPTDFQGDVLVPTLLVDESGDIYLSGGLISRSRGFVHFNDQGKRIGIDSSINERWYVQPGTGRRWVFDNGKIHLRDDAKTIKTIERRPDGNWIMGLSEASVASDGSLAVIAGSREMWEDRPSLVMFIDPDGDILYFHDLSPTFGRHLRLAFDGSQAVIAGDSQLLWMNISKEEVKKLHIARENSTKTYWTPFIIADKRELWLYDANRRVGELQRYRLPSM